jgi:hypothetical protein
MTDHPHFSVQHLTDFRINRYSEGGFMSKHYDSIHHSHGQHYGYPHATVLLYLNDDYEGGKFTVATKTMKPKARSAVVFPIKLYVSTRSRGCHQGNTLEYCIVVDVKTYKCFPTSIHEVKMDIDRLDQKNMLIYIKNGSKDDDLT